MLKAIYDGKRRNQERTYPSACVYYLTNFKTLFCMHRKKINGQYFLISKLS
jgi:hypothetical protein